MTHHFSHAVATRARFAPPWLSIAWFAGLLLMLLVSHAQAAAPAPLRTELTLTHIAADRWRADYVFAEPITAVALGAQVGPYRQQAWRLLTPGVVLRAEGDDESLVSTTPLTRLSVEIGPYDDFSLSQYVPISRFSDGGRDFYLGFLVGRVTGGGQVRAMAVTLHLRGLPGETVLPPRRPGTELEGYAYFGPGRPVRMGGVDVLIDPQAPAWLREVLADTTEKVSRFYEQALRRPLTQRPLISVAVAGFDGAPGSLNIKGGAVGGGVAYRLAGRGFVDDHPKKRSYIAALIAHEMAHVWQLDLKRGGVGEQDAWIHEGGAEALMLEAVRSTGIFTPEAADQYAQRLLKECEDLGGDVDSYRGRYACGFRRFHGYAMAPVPLWRALIERSESSGEFYSAAMVAAILQQAPAAAL